MDVKDLVTKVRDSIFEQDETVITDRMILGHLDKAYRYVYDLFAKSNPSYIGKQLTIQTESGRYKYNLPFLHNKRIISVDVQSYVNIWDRTYQIERINWMKMKNYLSKQTTFVEPKFWAVLRNDLYLYPTNGKEISLYVIPERLPFGLQVGTVVSYADDEISMTGVTKHIDSLSDYENIISVSDFQTGELKFTLYVEEVNGTEVKLGKHPNRTTYKGGEITNITSTSVEYATYNQTTGRVRLYGDFTVGLNETVQFDFTPTLYTDYLTQEALNLDPDLSENIVAGNGYSPADAVFSETPFSEEFYTVLEVGTGYIEVEDLSFKPLVVDGKVFSDTSIPTPVVSSSFLFLSETPMEVTGTFTGSLTVGQFYTLVFSSSGDFVDYLVNAEWDGTKFLSDYTIPSSDSEQYDSVTYFDDLAAAQVVVPTYPTVLTGTEILLTLGHDFGGIGETVRVTASAFYDPTEGSSQYIQADIVSSLRLSLAKPVATSLGTIAPTSTGFSTGIPQLVTYDLSFDNVNLADTLTGTPDLLLKQDTENELENIMPDDIVTLGRTTGTSCLGDTFEDYITDYASLMLRGSLNETDSKLQRSIDRLERQINTDIGSRELDNRIKRETPRFMSRVSRCRGAR